MKHDGINNLVKFGLKTNQINYGTTEDKRDIILYECHGIVRLRTMTRH